MNKNNENTTTPRRRKDKKSNVFSRSKRNIEQVNTTSSTKTKVKKGFLGIKRPLGKKDYLKIFGLFCSVAAICGVALFSYIWFKTPEITDQVFWKNQNASVVLDGNGKEIGKLSTDMPDWIDLKDDKGNLNVSKFYIDALAAMEDNTFEKNSGINWKGMLRSIVTGRGGGSSITMQLAKLIFNLSPYEQIDPETGKTIVIDPYPNGIDYKLTQMILAWKVTMKYSKDEIMENYVNTLYYGPECGYGVKNAAKCFYGKDPKDLNLAESSALAGLTNRPSQFNPYRKSLDADGNGKDDDPWDYTLTGAESYKSRGKDVLNAMLNDKRITQEEFDKASNEDALANLKPASDFKNDSLTEADELYLAMVRDEIANELSTGNTQFLESDVGKLGVVVYTHYDRDLQKATYDMLEGNSVAYPYNDEPTAEQKARQEELSKKVPPEVDPNIPVPVQGLSMSMNTQTGAVYAGSPLGRNPQGASGNLLRTYLRQPGSTSKPIIDYAPAVEYLGWSTAHQVDDTTANTNNGKIGNWDNKFLGPMTMAKAIAQSRNTTAVQTFNAVNNEIGSDRYREWMVNYGFSTFDKKLYPNGEFSLADSIGGWSYGATMYEMTAAYAAFGNGGKYNTPHTIDKMVVKETSTYYNDFKKNNQINDKNEFVFEKRVTNKQVMKPETAFLMAKALDPNYPGSVSDAAIVRGMPDLAMKTGSSNWPEQNNQGLTEDIARDEWVVGFTPDVTTAVWTGFFEKNESVVNNLGPWPQHHKQMFNNIMSYVNNNSEKYDVADGYKQPDNVVALCAATGNPPKFANGNCADGRKHWFIKGSADYPTQTAVPKKAKKPNVKVNGTDVSWDKPDSTGNLSWAVDINGTTVGTTGATNYSFTLDKLISDFGCKASYTVGVILTDSEADEPSDRGTATIVNTKGCEKPNTGPTISATPALEIPVNSTFDTTPDGLINAFSVTAKDYKGNDLTTSVTTTTDLSIDLTTAGTYVITFTVTDSDNLTKQVQSKLIIIEDSVDPGPVSRRNFFSNFFYKINQTTLKG
ncbi:MAG: transglycosylase domain-containing protein [Mycoplasmatales bacterium]